MKPCLRKAYNVGDMDSSSADKAFQLNLERLSIEEALNMEDVFREHNNVISFLILQAEITITHLRMPVFWMACLATAALFRRATLLVSISKPDDFGTT